MTTLQYVFRLQVDLDVSSWGNFSFRRLTRHHGAKTPSLNLYTVFRWVQLFFFFFEGTDLPHPTPEKATAPHSSTLGLENPIDGGAW